MLLGLFVGLRHAFEPDHLTAMATLVGETGNARRGALLGAIWGLGHTISLVAVGIVLMLVGAALPVRVAASFELAVAAVLVLLGIRAVVHARRNVEHAPSHVHRHGGRAHRHGGPVEHVHLGRWTVAWRPLAVGLVHGLAGSGALTALVFAQLSSSGERLAYITLFGFGSVSGMALVSALAGASLNSISHRTRRVLLGVAGVLSIVVGIAWSVPLYGQL